MTTAQRIFRMVALVLASGSIYLLPYMRQSYKMAMCRAFGLSVTQLGVANSAFGLTAMASYVPGGWLADRFGPRLMLTLALGITGASGLYFATFPGQVMAVGLHVLWGVSTIMLFWPALIKATRDLAPPHQQGRAFGVLEGGRGVVEALSAWLALTLFSRFADESSGLAVVIVIYAAIPLAATVLVWSLLKEPDSVEKPARVEDSVGRSATGIRLLLAAARLPGVWLLTVVILAAYIAFWGGFDLSAFAERAFGKSAEFAATLSNYRMGFRAVAPVLAGIVADRLGASRTSAVLFVVLVLSFGLFSSMPVGPGWLWLLWSNTALASVAVFSLRGIYYALLEEARIPSFMTGSATGIVSFLAYTPDAFIPVVNGLLLDRFPGTAGHRYYYLLIASTSILGLLAALAIRRRRRSSVHGSASATRR